MLKEPLNPEGSFRTRWDILLLLFLLYVCFTAPVMVCFDINLNSDQPLWWFEIVVMVFFMIDVILNFNTAYRGTEAMTLCSTVELELLQLELSLSPFLLPFIPPSLCLSVSLSVSLCPCLSLSLSASVSLSLYIYIYIYIYISSSSTVCAAHVLWKYL